MTRGKHMINRSGQLRSWNRTLRFLIVVALACLLLQNCCVERVLWLNCSNSAVLEYDLGGIFNIVVYRFRDTGKCHGLVVYDKNCNECFRYGEIRPLLLSDDPSNHVID
jgi:hypothetical protein